MNVAPQLRDNEVSNEYCTVAPDNPKNAAGKYTSYEIIRRDDINEELLHSMDSREQQSISIQSMRKRSLTTSDADQGNNYIEIVENCDENFAYERTEILNNTQCQCESSVGVTLSRVIFHCNEIRFRDDNGSSQPKSNNEIYDNSTYECIVENVTLPNNDGSAFCLDITNEELTSTYCDIQEFPAAQQKEFSCLAISPGNFIKQVSAEIFLGINNIVSRYIADSIKFANSTL